MKCYSSFVTAAITSAFVAWASSGCSGESETDLVASAKRYIEKNDSGSAVIQIKKGLQKNPDSGELRLLLGDTLLKSGDAPNAVVELTKARALKVGDERVLLLLAKAMLASGQDKKLIEDYAGAKFTDSSSSAEFQSQLATAYFNTGQMDRGRAAVEEALKLNPKSVTARLMRARLQATDGAVDRAAAIVDGVLADDPKVADAWQLKGELLSLQGRPAIDAGIDAFRRALAIDPKLPSAHAGLIKLLLLKDDVAAYKTQVAELRKALPGSLASGFYTAQLAFVGNDLKAAHEAAQQLLKTAPKAPGVLQLAGIVELRRGDLLMAERLLTQAVQGAPEMTAARRYLAETYLRSGQTAKTLDTLRPLLENSSAKPDANVLGLAAEAYLLEGSTAKAEEYFTRAAKADPDDSRSRVALAIAQISNGKSEAGFFDLESIAAADKATYADMALISERMRRGNFDDALRAVDRLQGKLANKPLPYLLRGRIFSMRKDLPSARASFEKALAIDAVYFPAVAALADIDAKENKLDAARQRFEALLARQPKDFRAMLALSELRRRTGSKPEAVEPLLVAAVKAAPEEPAPRLALIEHHLTLRHAKAALEAAQEAVGIFPDDILLLDALGRSQLAAGDVQQSMFTFRKIASARPLLPEPYLRMAAVFANSKDYAAAAVNVRKALEASPKLLAAQQMLVQIELAQKYVGEALKVAKEVQRQRPMESAGYVLESDIQFDQKSWDPAINAMRAALEREHSTPLAARLYVVYTVAGRNADSDRFADDWLRERPQDTSFLFHIGTVAMERKDYAMAEKRYRQFLAQKPDDPVALNNIAALMLQQHKSGALPLAERSNELAPDQAAYMDTLASAYAADKQYQKALEIQRRAVARAPDTPGLQLNLAKMLIDSGDKAGAKVELDKLAALGEKFPGQWEVTALLKRLGT